MNPAKTGSRNVGVIPKIARNKSGIRDYTDETFPARRDLLAGAREEIRTQMEQTAGTLKLLDYKVSKYDEAVRTGHLSWDEPESTVNEKDRQLQDETG